MFEKKDAAMDAKTLTRMTGATRVTRVTEATWATGDIWLQEEKKATEGEEGNLGQK